MKRIRRWSICLGVSLVIVMLASLIEGCMGTDEVEASKTRVERDHEYNQKLANSVVLKMKYIKDPRGGGLCFAYFWGGGDLYGGPALANVSCESVSPGLLTVANIH
jgi:hypothetical protein